MTLHVDIRKKLGDFHLEAAFDAGAEQDHTFRDDAECAASLFCLASAKSPQTLPGK